MFTETLMAEVKAKCYCTDDDELTNKKINRTITSATKKIIHLLGVSDEFDFEEQGNEDEMDLFLNCCWYIWNDSGNEFNDNYIDDIYRLRDKHKVLNYVQKEEN